MFNPPQSKGNCIDTYCFSLKQRCQPIELVQKKNLNRDNQTIFQPSHIPALILNLLYRLLKLNKKKEKTLLKESIALYRSGVSTQKLQLLGWMLCSVHHFGVCQCFQLGCDGHIKYRQIDYVKGGIPLCTSWQLQPIGLNSQIGFSKMNNPVDHTKQKLFGSDTYPCKCILNG